MVLASLFATSDTDLQEYYSETKPDLPAPDNEGDIVYDTMFWSSYNLFLIGKPKPKHPLLERVRLLKTRNPQKPVDDETSFEDGKIPLIDAKDIYAIFLTYYWCSR